MTAKRDVVLQYVPGDRYVAIQDLCSTIAREEGVRYSTSELRKTLENLRKNGLVTIRNRPGPNADTVTKNAPKTVATFTTNKPKPQDPEPMSEKKSLIRAIEEAQNLMIDAAGKMDQIKQRVSNMDECDKEELDALRTFKRKFKEFLND